MRWLALCLALVALGSAADAPIAPAKGDGIFRTGKAHLDSVERRLAQDTGNTVLGLDRLRTLYFLSVADDAWLPRAEGSLAWLQTRRAIDPWRRQAYRGAFDVVRAKHAFWPPAKLDFLKKAEPLLDEAVRRSPADAEVRYLRLMSCYYLPFFFGRSWSVKEDFAALARLLPQRRDLPAGLHARIARFVLDKAPHLPKTDRARLEADLANTENLARLTRDTP